MAFDVGQVNEFYDPNSKADPVILVAQRQSICRATKARFIRR